jgi:hypothetical protein
MATHSQAHDSGPSDPPTGFLAAWERLLGARRVPTLPRRRGRKPRAGAAAAKLVERDRSEAQALGVTATPTFFFGQAANLAVFTVVNALWLRPLPFPDVDRFITLSDGGTGATDGAAFGGLETPVGWTMFEAVAGQVVVAGRARSPCSVDQATYPSELRVVRLDQSPHRGEPGDEAYDFCDDGLQRLAVEPFVPSRSASCLINLTLVTKCERAVRASHATGARRRSGARESV